MKNILIPDLGDIGEVDVIEIPIEVGDELQQEDTMLVLESEKATMEVPIPESGTVKEILIKVGDKVKQGDAFLVFEAETPAAQQQATAKEQSEATEEVTEEESSLPADTSSQTTNEAKKSKDIVATEPGSNEAIEQPLFIPDIGDLEDVEVIELQIKAGDKVTREQTLLVLESEKASMDVPAPMDGEIVSLSVAIGDKLSSGSQIGVILAVSESKAAVVEDVSQPEATQKSSQQPTPKSAPIVENRAPVPERPALQGAVNKDLVHASPGVRRYARELGADIAKIDPSGPKSRVLKSDVKQYIKDQLSKPRATTATQGATLPVVDHSKYGEVEEVPLTRIQKFSSTNLHRNWVTIPHVTQFEEADITEMEAFRQSMKQEAANQGVKMTPLAFMLKAVATTLQSFPTFNASLATDGEHLVLKKYIHIGVAVDTPNGLVVPVIRDVDKKNLYDLANELGEVSALARDGKLSPAAMKGSCFSISSLGGIGGSAFTPIVNWPDVAILGVSKSQMKPIWDGSKFEPRLMLPLSLSYDHRVIDGALAARFSGHLSKVLGDIRRILL